MKRNLPLAFAVILTLSLMPSLLDWNVGAQTSPAPQTKDSSATGERGAAQERERSPRSQDEKGSLKTDRKRKPAPADKAVENDGDLPNFMNGKVNRKEYLRKRAEQIGMLRGRSDAAKLKDSPRIRAIQELERQESSLRKAAAEGRVQPLISNTSWTPIGPAPLPNGQTDTVTTPVNGRVTCVAIHPTNIDIVYVGTAQSGVYRTLNGGQTWTPILDSAQTLAIGSIAIDPITPTTIFVGTGEGNLGLDNFEGVGIYRVLNADTAPVVQGPFESRTNGGGGHAFVGTAINKIIIDPTNNNNMFVGNTLAGSGMSGEGTCCGGTNPASAFIGLYFSANAQAATPTWIRVGTLPGGGLAGITDISIDPTNANVLVLNQQDFFDASLSGVYRSTNALSGATATFTRVINYAGTFNNAKLASYKPGAANAVFYLASEEGANEGAVRRSTDGGATWTAVGALGGTGFCSPQCFYDIAVDVDPGATTATTDDIVYLGGAAGNTIFQKSTNGAATFTPSQRGLHADTHAIEIAPSNPNVVYTGDDGGIFRSYNKAADWNSLNNTGFNALQFQSLALHPTDRYFTIGGTQDNGTEFLQPDGNTQLPYNSWRRADFGDGGFAQIDQSGGSSTSVVTMYHTYFNATGAVLGFARVSSTACATEGQWAFKGFGAPPGFVNACGDAEGPNGITPSDNVLFYAPLELGPGTPNTVYYGTDRLYRSINRGDTMTLASQAPLSPIAGNPTIGSPISAIGISPQDDNVRLVGLANGALFFTTTGLPVLTSLDPVGAGSVIPDKYVGRVRFDPTNANTAYITLNGFTGAQNHVYRVTNLSTTPVITNISGTGATGIPDIPVNAFAVDPLNPTSLYAGTDIGVYISTNGGTTWAPYGTGLPRVAVFDMEIHSQHRLLRIATHGKGMWDIGLVPGSTLTISGTIRDASSNPISGAIVRLNNNAATEVTTTAAGTYTFTGLAVGSNNTVSVTKAATRFAPAYRTFNDMSTNQTGDFTGTPAPGGTPPTTGAILISEFRTEGPAGATDEFVELYNNTDAPVTVQASDATAGWAVYALDATSTTSVEIAIIPNGTVIPARGHFLLTGSAYSLRTLTVSDFNYNADIPNNTGVALFRTTSISPFNAADRLDAIGFFGVAGATPDMFREGSGITAPSTTGLQHSYVRRTLANGNPRDTNENATDVALVSTNAAPGSVLGAPGPENVFSPITRTGRYTVGVVDPSQCTTCQPNYERVGSDYGVNKAFGTLTLRRKFTNNTGQTATRLRFRVIDITTLNTPGVGADLRLVDSTDTIRGAFTIRGTQLELPMQPLGGGYNSSATVVLPDGGLTSTSGGTCPAGATCSLDVQFTLGVQVQGAFRFIVNIESLP
ncbi:MAG TPA: lamin tail domain-containing protein [Pyrinomonadaceae bacterium]|jgi:hypothetical protein